MAANARRNGRGPAHQPKWTVLVYLAGDNNLTSNCITVLQQLEAVKYKKNVRVLACFDSNTPWPKGSRYLAINGKWQKNNKDLDWELYNDLIITEKRGHKINPPDFCEEVERKGTPMTKTYVSEGLRRFLKWAWTRHSKTERYMLILYGHGPVVAGKTFMAQENPTSALNMEQLAKILSPYFGGRRRKLDILAFQNCAMNGIETAYQVKDQAEYLIGSQGLVLAYGWPYESIISALISNANAKPLQITKKILQACARHLIDFSVMDRSSEQSVCDLSLLRQPGNITSAIRELSTALQESLRFVPAPGDRKLEDKEQRVLEFPIISDAVRLARLEAQSFWAETFVDLYDFCERLLKKCNEAIVVQADLARHLNVEGNLETQIRNTALVRQLRKIMSCCLQVMNRVEEMVPYSYYIGSELQYSKGLSIYFPWTMPGEPYSFYYHKTKKEHRLVNAFETYSSYDFAEESAWAKFLKSFYAATLRKVRRAERKYSMRGLKQPLSLGMVRENYLAPSTVYTTEYLQKTDSNSGGGDRELGSYVKNYPRRNYLSPSDCPRKVEKEGKHLPAKSRHYKHSYSPPVSYLGWNMCEFLADVIGRKSINTKKTRKGGSVQSTRSKAQP